MDELKAQFEGVICVYKGDDLVAVIRKPNGAVIFHSASAMGFEEIGHLLGTQMTKQQ